jgi:ribose/xylose/arabinose/galactoside ABC-type transport system permease subunit
MNVLRQNSFAGILAAGMTFAILTGGIDLSVGSVVAMSGVLCADALAHGQGGAIAIAAGLCIGILVGLLNGTLITKVKLPPFLVTLAMMLIVRGGAWKYTDARPIAIPNESFAALSAGVLPFAIMVLVFVGSYVTLVRTPFGRYVYAIGGSREAARLAGIRVERQLLYVYVLSGAAAGLAGVLMASRLGAGHPNVGEYSELDAVAAVVVGGTSLFGGRGSIWGTLAGAFFVGILNNGLNLFNVDPYDQQIAKGAVLVLATSLDLWRGGAK